MRTLFISNDPAIFDPDSAVRARLRAYAAALGEAHVISPAREGAAEVTEGALHLYPLFGSRLFRVRALTRKAREVMRRVQVDVVSAQDPFEHGFAALQAIRGTAIKLHVQMHTDPFAPGFARVSMINRLRLHLMPQVLRAASRIRVVSEELKREVAERYHPRAPITVLPIYADLERFRTLARNPEKGQLLWVGRFEAEKDPFLALDALAAARKAGIDAHLTMLGSGRLQAALIAHAKGLGVAHVVEFPGHIPDVLPYLATAELMLVTSHYEGYGMAIVEALAAGVPVLSTDVGIAREAGATIAPSSTYRETLVALLASSPLPPARLSIHTFSSFEEYVAAYAADIQATLLP